MGIAHLGVCVIMDRAAKRQILIPAFNVAHLPMVKPIIGTLTELDTFGLVEVARPDVEKFGAQSFAAVAEEYMRLRNLEVTRLHLDHVPVLDEAGQRVEWKPIIEKALELGYDSVMLDGSRLDLDENIAATREAVEMAHDAAAVLEAELGAVLGHEEGPLPPYDELFASGQGFTDPNEAGRFVCETHCDWLSVAVGNIHGAISGTAAGETKVHARLNLDHLDRLREATGGIPLVLHGGSGIQLEYLQGAVARGIAKINVGTEIRQAYEAGLALDDQVEQGQLAVAMVIRRLVDDYGIAGSAARLAEA